jgi:hypothetical protein
MTVFESVADTATAMPMHHDLHRKQLIADAVLRAIGTPADFLRRCSVGKGVTVERIERAIHIVADMMVKHDRPGLMATIRRLEAERDRLRNETDPMEYAKQILRLTA